MKIVTIQVIDTDKQFSDGITNQLPDGEISCLVDLGDIMLDCEKVIRKHCKMAKQILKQTEDEEDGC